MNISATTGTSSSYDQQVVSVDQDSQLKAIQIQIQKVQQEILSISTDKELSSEDKINQQQQLQQQLQNLNNELMQRRSELAQEKTAAREGTKEKAVTASDTESSLKSERSKFVNSEEQENEALYQAIEKQEKGQYVNIRL